jgi:6-pyruvoyltetrahydropterin/6-carboxytetrahydropterin synthase
MYHLSIEAGFSAAHQIKGHKGSCKRLHGHNWKVQVEVGAENLSDIGIAIDFQKLTDLTRLVLNKFDHQYINEVPPFEELNPTAENLARYIYEQIESKLPEGIKMKQVSLWEGEKYCVRYSKSE